MEQNIYFERCIDFMARMIEKYGDEILLPDLPDKGDAVENQEKTA